MNEVLQLKGTFEQKSNSSTPGAPNLPQNGHVETNHLRKLRKDLNEVLEFWKKEKIISTALVSVYYRDVVAKSNRIKGILAKGSNSPNESVVGAKFSKDGYPKHIITHCVDLETVKNSIDDLDICIQILAKQFNDKIKYEDIVDINKNRKKVLDDLMVKSKFVKYIVDAYYLEAVGVEKADEEITDSAIVTIYQTGMRTKEIMDKLGINLVNIRMIDETTMLLTPEQYLTLKNEVPYLIAMAVTDISEFSKEDFEIIESPALALPKPGNEPIIGVIDTLFDDSVYFSEWVEYQNKVDPNIPIVSSDYQHGTKVSSIIVDGPAFNPVLDDGCGRFRVRHFGVATGGKFSSFSVLRAIKEIVSQNKDIKVWNLSLGSAMEINPNFISPEAAVLDQIQYENDVIFVIAGTNKEASSEKRRIGAPADSINSIVVNAVDFEGKPASYSREGLVLSFFNKPDISYYGGDKGRAIRTCSPTGESMVTGTSYAAPWISRKVAYLIHILGLSREVAKALLIDAAAGWQEKSVSSQLIGYGVVPVRIEDIIKSEDDEIKFILTGQSLKYDTYNYNIPVPIYKGKHPFIAKATLCYFPKCTRNQGVDYTNTELDLHFGRIKGTSIKPIDHNEQGTDNPYSLHEGKARKLFRKWDNVKHISEELKQSAGMKKAYETGNWGISIKTKERLDKKDGVGLNFGVVITLKEINGVNRIEEFIQLCSFRAWFVNRINIENKLDIYNIAEEEIEFD